MKDDHELWKHWSSFPTCFSTTHHIFGSGLSRKITTNSLDDWNRSIHTSWFKFSDKCRWHFVLSSLNKHNWWIDLQTTCLVIFSAVSSVRYNIIKYNRYRLCLQRLVCSFLNLQSFTQHFCRHYFDQMIWGDNRCSTVLSRALLGVPIILHTYKHLLHCLKWPQRSENLLKRCWSFNSTPSEV